MMATSTSAFAELPAYGSSGWVAKKTFPRP